MHEKGEHDGEGPCIKRPLCRQEMNFTTTSLIQDAKSIVEWCCLVMVEGTRIREDQLHKKGHVHIYFWEVVDVYWSQWYECITIQATRRFHLVITLDNAIFEIWMRKNSCFYGPCSSNEWDDCESTIRVDRWDRVSLPIVQCITMELSQLEEDQSSISSDYDNVSELVLWCSLNPSIKFWITRMNVLFFGHLVDSHFGTPFFAGHIYKVVSPRDNEWGTNYWLARCLEGNNTIMQSVTDSKGI